jgi:hypothetical protein
LSSQTTTTHPPRGTPTGEPLAERQQEINLQHNPIPRKSGMTKQDANPCKHWKASACRNPSFLHHKSQNQLQHNPKIVRKS